MSAGSVLPPHITPLKAPTPRSSRNLIDAETEIEIKSETPNAQIYYTLDGSLPQPFAGIGLANATLKYQRPFRLPDGRTIVKAVALSKNGLRESRVVTKTFHVGNSAKFSTVASVASPKSGQSEIPLKRSNSAPRLRSATNSIKAAPSSNEFHFRKQGNNLNQSHDDTLSKSNASSLRAIVSQLICPQCCAPRQSPAAKFCTECGIAYPILGPNRPSSSQISKPNRAMGECLECGSYVPLNSPWCAVCGAGLQDQLPQSLHDSSMKLRCEICNAFNPLTATNCLECGYGLSAAQTVSRSTQPPMELISGKMNSRPTLPCSRCRKLNPSTAKYCINCGQQIPKPQTAVPTNCPRCSCALPKAENIHFCPACGALCKIFSDSKNLKTETKIRKKSTGATQSGAGAGAGANQYRIRRKSLPNAFAAFPYFGGRWPTAAAVQGRKKHQSTQTLQSNRPKNLSTVSPGKGFWRQQLDHITEHIRFYTEQNSDFRNLISEPRLGKILHGESTNDRGIVRIALDFEEVPENFRSTSVTYVPVRSRSAASIGSQRSKTPPGSAKERPRSPGSAKERPRPIGGRSRSNSARLTKESALLLEYLHNGSKDPDELKNLLENGSDPNCEDRDGLTPLAIAVRQRDLEAIPILITAGAEINKKFGERGNTVLHEAVQLGPPAKPLIEELLKAGANPTIENGRRQTPQQLAISQKFYDLSDIIAAHISQEILSDKKVDK